MAVSRKKASGPSWSIAPPGVPIGRLLGSFTAHAMRTVSGVVLGLAATGPHNELGAWWGRVVRKRPDVR